MPHNAPPEHVDGPVSDAPAHAPAHGPEDHAEGAHADPFDPAHLIGHVKDAEYFEVPRVFAPDGKAEIPQVAALAHPIQLGGPFEPLDLRLTKFMILEVVAALLIAAIFIPLARRIATGGPPRGRLWNMFEAMLLFMRDEVARPSIGKHDADKFLPFIWTLFFFVLMCNLLGLVPWAGSPTGALAVTGMLALITFGAVVGAGMIKMGPGHFWVGLVPHMDLPPVLMVLLWPMIFLIEILGLLIRHFVLSVRLLANMLAGHLVLAVIVGFILASAGNPAWFGVTSASVLGATALMMLELFVAFLQAYIFAFLSALFIGMAVHPH
jgi:F-type H+-transporting ATPase subunit a